jgi:hypothetical protein
MQGTGYIARGVKRRELSWLARGDKPKNESEFKELTVEHCTTMAPQLVGKPIKFAHKDSKFGIVTASRFSEDSGDWEIDFEVSNDNPYTPKQVQATIESGLCLGLSLSHPQYFSGEKKGQLAGEPIEVSVCEIPAREGCYITKFNSYRYNTDDRGWIPGQSRGFDQVVQASMADKDTKMTSAEGGGGTAFPTTPGMTPPAAAGSNQGQGSVSMDTDADDLKSLLEKNREHPLTMQLAKAFLKDKQKLEEKAKTLLAAEAKKNHVLQKKLAQSDDIARRGVDVTHKLVESLLQKAGKQAALQDHRQQMDSNPEYRQQVAGFGQSLAGQALMVQAEFGCLAVANQQLPQPKASSTTHNDFLEVTQGLWKSDIEIPDQHRSVSEAVPVSASSSSSSSGQQQAQRPRFNAPRDSRQELEDYYLKLQSQNLDKWTDKLSLNPVDIYNDDEADPNNPLVKHARNVQAHFEKNGQGSASKKRKLGATEDYVPAVHDGES